MLQRKLYDWLVVVFLHEVQNDGNYSDQMITAIEKAGASDNIAVFLVRDALGPDNTFLLTASQLTKQPAGNWQFCPIDKSKLRIDNKKKNCWEQALHYIYKNFTGERNMLMTFSEGACVGINVEQKKINRPAAMAPQGYIDFPIGNQLAVTNQYYVFDQEEMEKLMKDPNFSPVTANFKRQGDVWLLEKRVNQNICKNLEILWVTQLADAIGRCLYGQNIDILLMTNCYMQVFDTGYELSNKVKFLIGAEGPLPMEGYDYGKLINTLNASPDINSKKLSAQICADLQNWYIAKNEMDNFNGATVFANRLKFYPLALRVFQDLIADLTELLSNPAVVRELKTIQGLCNNVTNNANYLLVDAGRWISLVTQRIPQLTNGVYYNKLFCELQAKIRVTDTLSKYIRTVDAGTNQKYGYSGISIYYPADRQMHQDQAVMWCACFDSAVARPFQTISRWNKFLDRYFEELGRLTPAASEARRPLMIAR